LSKNELFLTYSRSNWDASRRADRLCAGLPVDAN
jgi:hypothetical protein